MAVLRLLPVLFINLPYNQTPPAKQTNKATIALDITTP